ncbi:tryptophan-rich sensory protein [Mycolicibacterium parafortuitum]|uniref:Tryptophan-rich sensory protein n=1 Tax=Mycolicibacterium parafortuitum TaxID=39692 RepID=A0A7I7U8M5_MYCPF|nr:tryptophan-rich sensory protein [Mycolicibacterium parafortuitum]
MRFSTLAKTAGGSIATGVIGGLATRPAVQSSWYRRLRKPSFQPPPAAFPIVWNLLYADISGVSATTIDGLEERGDTAAARAYSRALALNLALNASWSWVFFNRRKLGPAAVVAGRWRSAAPTWRAEPARCTRRPAPLWRPTRCGAASRRCSRPVFGG